MPDRPVVGQVEQRAVADAATPTMDGKRLRGIVPYGVESRDLGGWREVMESGCLRGAKLDDLVATVDHAGVPIGRHPRTLEVEDTPEGLRWSVELPESRSDVREAVERGDLASGSWRMIVAKDRWEGDVRHVLAVAELRDLSVVTRPAYREARAEFRSAPETPSPDATTPAEPDGPTGSQTPEEAIVPDAPEGGLRIEDRTAGQPQNVESRVLDAMAHIPKGEARDLVHATTDPVQPDDVSSYVWDRLRDNAVVLATGMPIFTTSRKTMKWPVITGDITAEFYDELEEIVESDPTFADYEVEPKAIKALVRGSSEAFEDSDPDLLGVVAANMTTALALRLDRELLVGNTTKGFKGLTTMTGTQTLAVGGALSWDHLLKAAGLLAEAHIPGPYVAITHPRVSTALGLTKTAAGSNELLSAPDGAPPTFVTSQIGVTTGGSPTSTVVVFAPSQLAVVRRRDVTIEVDRSQEFTSDAVLVRGKLRAAMGTPRPEAVVKLTGVAAPAIA